MTYLLWIQHLINILPQFLQLFMQYITILDSVITALDGQATTWCHIFSIVVGKNNRVITGLQCNFVLVLPADQNLKTNTKLPWKSGQRGANVGTTVPTSGQRWANLHYCLRFHAIISKSAVYFIKEDDVKTPLKFKGGLALVFTSLVK